MTPLVRIKNNVYKILSTVPNTYRCSKMVALHMSAKGIQNELE